MLFILTHSPKQHLFALESLDAVMTAALFDQSPQVVFCDQGLAILNWQEAQEKLSMLGSLGVQGYYLLPPETHTVNYQPCSIPLSAISYTELHELCDKARQVMSF